MRKQYSPSFARKIKLIGKSDYQTILKDLTDAFGSGSFSGERFSYVDPLKENEFRRLANLDWASASEEDLHRISEPNGFLTVEFHNSLYPKVFQFCYEIGDKARNVDFVECYWVLPVLGNKPYCAGLSHKQRLAVWDAYLYLFEVADLDFFVDWEHAKQLLKEKLFG